MAHWQRSAEGVKILPREGCGGVQEAGGARLYVKALSDGCGTLVHPAPP